jgi:hypothetical protein
VPLSLFSPFCRRAFRGFLSGLSGWPGGCDHRRRTLIGFGRVVALGAHSGNGSGRRVFHFCPEQVEIRGGGPHCASSGFGCSRKRAVVVQIVVIVRQIIHVCSLPHRGGAKHLIPKAFCATLSE